MSIITNHGKSKTSNKINLKYWKFEYGEITKLIWISGPHMIDNYWKAKVYFKSLVSLDVKKQIVDWGMVAFLKIGELYMNGSELVKKTNIKSEYLKQYKSNTMSLMLSNPDFVIKERQMELLVENMEEVLILNSFVMMYKELEIHIPVIEVARAILAKSKSLLYRILEPNSMDNLFAIDTYENNLQIYALHEYPKYLLRNNEHVLYIAWLLCDRAARKAWSDVYNNLLISNQLCFEFPLKGTFDLRVRYSKNRNVLRVEQILLHSGIHIPFKGIEVFNSPNISYNRVNQQKRYSFIVPENKKFDVDTESGAKKELEIVQMAIASIEMDKNIPVYYKTEKTQNVNTLQDSNTKEYFREPKEEVSIADSLRQENKKGLEIENIDEEAIDIGKDIHNMALILNELRTYPGVNVSYHIDVLPLGIRRKSFRYLDNTGDVRKYLSAEISFGSRLLYLIDVERENRSLATLVFYTKDKSSLKDKNKIEKEILEQLVENNGVWFREVFLKYQLLEKRLKHLKGQSPRVITEKYFVRLKEM